jgi:RNA polymerase sigma-70 factor (ECF subfamily)
MTTPAVGGAIKDERELALQAQQGDRQAFATLIERYWDAVYRWLYHLSHHRHTAEDLTQETFLRAFAALSSFEAGSNFRAWLFRIAYNALLNLRHSQSRERQPLPEDLAMRGEGPPEQVASREMLQVLAKEVAKLPPEFRAALLLRAEQELSFRDIGTVLGVTEETARWRVFKARRKLMQVVDPYLRRESS